MTNVIYFSIEKYINTASLALYSFILAKILGVELFGYIAHKEAIIMLLSILSLQGLDSIIQRELLHNKNETKEIIGTVLLIKTLFIFLSLCILMSLNFSDYNQNIKGSIVWILFLLIPSISINCLSSHFIVTSKASEFFKIGITVTSIGLIYKVTVLQVSENINYLVFGLIIDYILYSLAFVFYFLYNKIPLISFSLHYCKIYIKEGMLLILSGAMIVIYSRIDQIMLGYFSDYNDVGNYSLSNKFVFLYVILASVFNLAFIPKLNKHKDNYIGNIRRLGLLSFKVGLFMSVLNAILSPLIIYYFYGESFDKAILLALISSPIILFVFLSSSSGKVLVMEHQSQHALYRNVLAVVVNIILNLLLIPEYGAVGAVISSIIAWMCSSFIYLVLNKDTKDIFKTFYGLEEKCN